MAFAYVPMSPDDKKLLEMIFTDEFMQAETNFEAFRDFQSSSAVFTNWKSDIMVYNEEVFDGLSEKVHASHHGMKWYVRLQTGHFPKKTNKKKVRFNFFGS